MIEYLSVTVRSYMFLPMESLFKLQCWAWQGRNEYKQAIVSIVKSPFFGVHEFDSDTIKILISNC